MSKQTLPSVPDENGLEELLYKIRPVPGHKFHQQMEQAAWRIKKGGQPAGKYYRLRLSPAFLALLLLIILFVTPRGRAWAQEVLQFFARINSSTVELPPGELKSMQDVSDTYSLPLVPVIIPGVSPEMAALPGCETSQKAQSYGCQIALAESKLGFDLKELPVLPEDWKFDLISFSPASKSATIGYLFDSSYMSSGMFYLTQGEGEPPAYYHQNPWLVVPADQVESVKVGSLVGEYVEGSFFLQAGGSNLIWADSNEHKRLAWRDGTRWYLIDVWRNLNLPDTMGRDRLIGLAESLVASPVGTTEDLDPDYLLSVSDAELVSGLDLKAPSLLPMEMSFSHAQYHDYKKEVRLFYGFNNELVVHQWKGKSLDMSTLPTDYDPSSSYEIVLIHGGRAFYGFVEGPDPHHFLWWEKDGVNFQLFYYQYFGRLDRDQMISIAESMQDIDDFRTKDTRPYEYISMYGEALGIDVLEFPEPPDGWSYANVFGDPPARCLTIVYKSVTEPGYLLIYQCLTGTRFDLSDIPARYRKPVRIRSSWGIYAAGDSVTDDNGKLTWNPEAPMKQLHWQRDGLWIKLVISGESAVFRGQEDLISYAERLR